MRSSWVFYIALMVAAVFFSWAALGLWRSFQIAQIYSSEPQPQVKITSKHIAAIRQLRFDWNPLIEGGGPVIRPDAPYGSANLADDLGPIIGTRDPVSIARFHREVMSVLIDALRSCALAPGRYRLAHLDNHRMEQSLRDALAGLPGERIEAVLSELPRLSSDRYFDFTDQHQRLLNKISLKWPESNAATYLVSRKLPALAVNFKRPFGDMTAFEIDMGAILNLPRPQDNVLDPVFIKLYWEMWPALQTFVEYAPLEECAQ